MLKRNDILSNNDVGKMHQRNEMEINAFLPSIDKSQVKKIKPNYYKNKRKLNYSNLYEDEGGYVQTSVQNDSINKSQVFAKDAVLKNVKSKQSVTLKGDINQEERRAESMYQPKRERKFKRSPKDSRSSSRKKPATGKQSQQKKRPVETAGKERSSKSPLETPNNVNNSETGPLNLEIMNSQRPTSKTISKIKSIREKAIGVNTKRTFQKIEMDPSLFKIQVQKKHLDHLNKDDLDEISKFEVIYKILKDQLRIH
jgi:hypothetical protein